MIPLARVALGDLTAAELRLITTLREVASEPLRECLWGLLDDVIRFAAQPGCAEAGAGGVPCIRMHVACDQCRRVSAALLLFKRTEALRSA